MTTSRSAKVSTMLFVPGITGFIAVRVICAIPEILQFYGVSFFLTDNSASSLVSLHEEFTRACVTKTSTA